MTRFFSFTFFLLFISQSFAQWSLVISSKVERDDKGLGGAKISLIQGSKIVKEITSNNDGSFSIEVPPNGEFVIEVTYPGCNAKKFQVFTRGVPNDVATDRFNPKYKIGGFTMKPPLYSIDYSALKNPMVKIVYFPEQGKFDHESGHTEVMLNALGKIRDAENQLLEKQAAAVKTGDAALKKNDCETAKTQYELAVSLIPQAPHEDYSKAQLIKCNNCLQAKNNDSKLEEEKLQAEKKKAEKEKAEKEKLAREKAEQEKVAEETRKKEELEKRATAERLKAEQIAKENAEKIKKEEQKKLEEEKIAKEKIEKEKNIETERLNAERLALEKQNQTKAEQERIAQEKEIAEEKKAEEKKLIAEKEIADAESKKAAQTRKENAEIIARKETEKNSAEKEAFKKPEAKVEKQKKEPQKDITKVSPPKVENKKTEAVIEKPKTEVAIPKEKIPVTPSQEASTKKELIIPVSNTPSTNKKDIGSSKARHSIPQPLGTDRYKQEISTADEHFYMKRYAEAKESYAAALKIRPDDKYAQQKIETISRILATDKK